MKLTNTKGRLEVICGSMFSGKTQELIRRLRRAQIAQLAVQVFKPQTDTRHTVNHVHSHAGDKLAACMVLDAAGLRSALKPDTQVVGIDEIQFFKQDILELIHELIEEGKQVIVAGLDLDFRGLPFGCMPTLLALADMVTKLQAVCLLCGNDAHFTQRLVDGKPAKFTDPYILIGGGDYYQARCRHCYVIDQRPFMKTITTL